MHCSDFCIKINNTEATFLHQLAKKKFNKVTFYTCCIVEPTSCQCELSAGMYNRWCSQCAVIISTSERSDNGFRWNVPFEDTMHTNRSGTQAGKVAIAVREGENSHDHHAVAISEEDTCCTLKHLLWEISKECFFLLKKGGAIKSKTVEPYIHLMSTWHYSCDDKCSQDFHNFCCSSTIVILNTDQNKYNKKKRKKWGRPGKVSNKLVNIKMQFHI